MVDGRVRAERSGPYENFKFRLRMHGRHVAAFRKASTLKRTTDVVEQRAGADLSTSHMSPGCTRFEAITLERGLTCDAEFLSWAEKVIHFDSELGARANSLADVRKDLVLEVYSEAGRLALAYELQRCWVSDFQAVAELDAASQTVAIETLKLEHEGRERDASLPETGDS